MLPADELRLVILWAQFCHSAFDTFLPFTKMWWPYLPQFYPLPLCITMRGFGNCSFAS